MIRFLKIFTLALGLLTLMPVERAQADSVTVTNINGVGYVPLEAAWRKYNLKEVKTPGNDRKYVADNMYVVVRPGKQDFYVKQYHYVLSFPIVDRNGELYISAIDIEKLVDPVLAPRYSGRKVTTIVLDPGHGGHDSGAVSSIAREKDLNMQLAVAVGKKLQAAGYKVRFTRTGDYFLTLQQRVAIANQTPDCIFVSLHHNYGRSAAHGIETFTLAPHGTTSPFARTRRTEDLAGNNQDSENIALATAVHSRVIQSSKALDRGVQRARFSVLCTIKRPAILFEGGFVSNPDECTLLTQAEYRNQMAESICEGIRSFCTVICEKNNGLKTTNKLGDKTAKPGKGSGTIGGGKGKGKKTDKTPARSTMNSRYNDSRAMR